LSQPFILHALVLTAALLSAATPAHAQESKSSSNFMGTLGLNTIPSARMDEAGTLRIGVAHSDPYNQAFIGMQIAEPLYINLRQSMLVSSAGQKPSRVYPGLDFKLRLAEEGRYQPEVVFGMDSAMGHKRHSSEYFALSKRYYDFDFTAGVAWGRLGSAGHISNPFKRLSKHFENDREYNDENASSPSDWFTGEKIGFFGGVEYHTPVKGLSFKADIGADRYPGERNSFDFKSPSPWSVGFNYSPKDWASFGMSLIGGDKVMARLSFQDNIFKWNTKSYKGKDSFTLDKQRSEHSWRNLARDMAHADDINIGKTRISENDMSGVLHLNDYEPVTMQIGRAARHLSANAGKNIETVTVIPIQKGLRGKTITFSRRDLESAIAHNQGSPEEIWQDIKFSDDNRSISAKRTESKFKIFPELELSIGEEDTTHLYRASIVAEQTKGWRYGFSTGSSVRFNLADRLYQSDKMRPRVENPIRSDASNFAANPVVVDRSYLSWRKTIVPDLHFAATAGYLEEMFAGIGAELLYRPFSSPFAVGIEAWQAHKRDPDSLMALAIQEQGGFTGHLNLYYQIPQTDITAFAKVGKYLGGDHGATLGLQTQLANGMKVKGFVTATDQKDRDVFGKDANIHGGLQLAIPLGNMRFVPQGSEARVKVAPMARDAGQILDIPSSLYELTEPMSYRHLGRNWQAVLN
jgi:hypothetical protein